MANSKPSGALGRSRTCDQEIRRLLLYPLSYEGGGLEFQPNRSLHAEKTRLPRPLDVGVFVLDYAVECGMPLFRISRGQHGIRAPKKRTNR